MAGKRSEFLRPILDGARFQRGALPVDVLPELAIIRDLIIDVATHLFRQENPDRKRVPHGFRDKFRLVLTRIEQGSAVPVLEQEVSGEGTPPPETEQARYFERAREWILDLMEAANTIREIPPDCPRELLKSFERFGRHLREDEKVIFVSPVRRKPVQYSRETRKRLIRWSGSPLYQVDVTVTGRVVRINNDDERYFEVKTMDGLEFRVDFPAEKRPEVLDALANNLTVRCEAEGIGHFDSGDRLVRIEGIQNVSFYEAADPAAIARVDQDIAELAKLADGWFDGKGKAYLAKDLSWVRDVVVEALADEPRFTPRIYPTPDETVRVEWVCGRWDLSAEFTPLSQSFYFHALHLDTEQEQEETFAGSAHKVSAELARTMKHLLDAPVA